MALVGEITATEAAARIKAIGDVDYLSFHESNCADVRRDLEAELHRTPDRIRWERVRLLKQQLSALWTECDYDKAAEFAADLKALEGG